MKEIQNPLDIYSALYLSASRKVSIFQYKNGKAFRINDNIITELPYTKIVDEKNGYIRVYTKVNGVKKWGIISYFGEIIPPIYDYISPIIAEKYFRIFEGDYNWDRDDLTMELFFEHLYNGDSWNGDNYIGTLGAGKWGIIDSENKIQIPVKYEWVEFVAQNTVCCNIGGSRIIKWYHGDDKKKVWSIADGQWEVIYIDFSLRVPPGEYFEVIENFQKEAQLQLYPAFKYSFAEEKTIDKFKTHH